MTLAGVGFDGSVVGAFSDVVINLVAAGIGGVSVWLGTKTNKRLRLLRARRFWKAMGSREPFIVMGAPDWEPLSSWEKSGLVGKGDMLALVEIESQLRRLGFAGKIVESKELNSRELRSDLILIGGPDGNTATKEIMERLDGETSYVFAGDAPAVLHKGSDETAAPQYNKSGDPTNDYGLIIRAANPLAPDTAEVVILAGCWGFGTAAAAEKLSDRKFLRDQRKFKYFEALVETTVVRGSHYNTRVRTLRELTPLSAE
ncbi:hypothetical protein ILP97_06810 [Amycolatopsis sp. H6(2020)]|nr:hypothetical protein [Amycolatopsis sp. H6(2020)]